MKKTIAILAVLILALTCVFAVTPNATKEAAEGTAKININVTIGDKYPVFQFATKTGATVISTNVPNNTAVEATMTDAEAAHLTKANEQATVVFAINQASDAHCVAGYTLTVTATDLFLLKSADNTINRTFDAAQTAATATEKFTVDATIAHAKTTNETPVTDITYNDVTPAGSKIDINYTGILVPAETPIEIATATVKWNANVAAKAGNYQAAVTLTVAAN